ncbi:hypothetical protein AUC69_13310 [Methyloceanibacter superfactus]|jgi:hypothetical protein|uniref:Uncharacterized protein n=1 Tax=Methyloceanibacter superfactus TaxID=1774969 RepID=A0A1E3VUY3_9HYPH|nr:hypothetical protein [Methyloceanibacter superfactus]ODR97081.1 hypothetical protein AUC69_13310 [Methyloceanibacter superfactus]
MIVTSSKSGGIVAGRRRDAVAPAVFAAKGAQWKRTDELHRLFAPNKTKAPERVQGVSASYCFYVIK